MKKIALIAAAFVLASGVAMAKPATPVSAKISAPVAERVQVIASSAATGPAMWTCTGDTCEARLSATPNVRHCQALVQKVGAVTEFAALDAEKLARCNASARPATTAVASK